MSDKATIQEKYKLNDKQYFFALEYIVDLNATQACIRAGYSESTASQQGSRLLSYVKVAQAIVELKASRAGKLELTQERVLQEIMRLAFFDIRKLYKDDDTLKKITELDDDTAAALASVEVTRIADTEIDTIKVKMADKLAALEKLAKHIGLYKLDNEQKTDPLSDLLYAIATTSSSALKPIQQDAG